MKALEISEQIAECVGLWLAEGDSTTEAEITFTNNSWDLILYFHKTVKNLFKVINPRIYIYFPSSEDMQEYSLDNIRFRYYIDSRATKPYFIYRIADKELVKIWKEIVEVCTIKEGIYSFILRGFFAGEGNIKTSSHNSRTLRIAQKCQKEFINRILDYFGVDYKFSKRERAYVITNRANWQKLAEINIADLHPIKRTKFWNTYSSFKEWHYKHNFIKNNILTYLEKPMTSMDLARIFNRSQSRIQRILTSLKREGKITNYRKINKDYWIRVI